ncbi:tryptophan 2,3-dioxygenase family protein [Reichenbachiella agarivorans]|uniref:Tryptophan 2,3-dioxygenase family protein n=1 Tax=Reichenbachiella agarivorans TaxID=2979464 RepID=A0ABY6CQD1_9BACT|nr:tryptophan 2,3-dioxygenase family protein [Reichenbachiella agarivorans]UXP32706.1 tryptophan 2,3-dioxygenase family protein [Reichenbachiella agarivorans]
MSAEHIDPKILAQVKKLEEKYDAMGQDLSSYLDGLLHADYLTYWDYIHLDTLLSLQNPKTHFPDEKIFIIYHQITELYFQLILNEIEQIANTETPDEKWFAIRLKRINRYLLHLVDSFDVMIDGMDQEQFLQFRMSLLPASGFQSGQLRLIEFSCAPMINLVEKTQRAALDANDIEAMYPHLYWKKGATELATGKKTLTLRQFEEKYAEQFVKHATNYQFKNIWAKYKSDYEGCATAQAIQNLLKQLDLLANVNWRLAHYKSAVRYLQKDPDIIAATGGTNWQQYLPPRFQKVIFYPELWSEDELENWGRSWVEETVFKS